MPSSDLERSQLLGILTRLKHLPSLCQSTLNCCIYCVYKAEETGQCARFNVAHGINGGIPSRRGGLVTLAVYRVNIKSKDHFFRTTA
jgi:hypothetical protein